MAIKRKLFWSVAAFLLGVLTIWAVLYGSGMSPSQILEGVRSANKIWLIPAALCMLGIIWFEGQAVLSIVKAAGYPRKHRQGFVYAAADSYFSAITPSATGGQPASAFFMMRDKIPGAVATASLLVNLVAYNAAILTIGFISLLTRPGIFLNYRPVCRVLIILGILVLTVLGIVFFMLLWRQSVLHKIASGCLNLLTRIHLLRNPGKFEKKLQDTMREYSECVKIMSGQRKMWVLAYFFNLMQRVSQFTVTIFCYLAIGGKASQLYDLWITQCYVSLGANCIPIPGSMGVTDYLMLDGYMNLMDRANAFRLQVLARGLSFYCCIIISGLTVLGVWLYTRKRRNGSDH